ncbi:MAG: hypothetical protein QM270_04105 [Bacillota bacterium]|nr:hypothetical protein [Bacillota bacterium]
MRDSRNEHEHEEVWLPAYRELQEEQQLGDAARARILAAMQERAQAAPAPAPASTARRRRIPFPAKRWIVPAAAAALAVTLGIFWANIAGGARSRAPREDMATGQPTSGETQLALYDGMEGAAPADALPEGAPETKEEPNSRSAPEPSLSPTQAAALDRSEAVVQEEEDILSYARQQLRSTGTRREVLYSYTEKADGEAALDEKCMDEAGVDVRLEQLLAPLQLADAEPGVAQVLLGAPAFPDREAPPGDPPETIRIEAIRAVYGDGEELDPAGLRIRVRRGATEESVEALSFAKNIRLPALLQIDTRQLGTHEELVIWLVVDGEEVSLVLVGQP